MISGMSVILKSGGMFDEKLLQVSLSRDEVCAVLGFISELHGGKIKVLSEAPAGIGFYKVSKRAFGEGAKEQIGTIIENGKRKEAAFEYDAKRREQNEGNS